jgi:Tfp pilus assembly protein PilN
MIRINLLPQEIHAAEAKKQIAAIGIAAAALVVVALLFIGVWRFSKKVALERDLAIAKDELTKYEAIVNQVNSLEQLKNNLKSRGDVINQLLKGRLTYPKFFEDFMMLLPPDIWVGNFNTQPSADKLRVDLNASSLSNFAIADWLINLQTSPYFSEVTLGAINSQEAAENKPPVMTFTISFKYLRPDA